jgi:hypothetical protein
MEHGWEATHVAKPSRAGDPVSKRGTTGGAAPGRTERGREHVPEDDPLAVVVNADVNTPFAFALRQALKEAAPGKAEAKEVKEKEDKKAEVKRKRCADCWNCIIFRDENGHLMGRCKKNLWLKPTYSYEDINNDRVRRWHADCPEYDDSE